MNGPEHYAEAERLIAAAPDHLVAGSLDSVERAKLLVKVAAVHARLAAVALTYEMRTKEQTREVRFGPEWKKVTASAS